MDIRPRGLWWLLAVCVVIGARAPWPGDTRKLGGQVALLEYVILE